MGNPLNTGLPPPQAARSGDAIGDARFFPESANGVTTSEGAEWLRTGLAVPAANYPVAANLEHLKVIGVPVTNATTVVVTQVADNGAGTIVAAYGDPNNVLVSTDYGASWNTVAHNCSGNNATAVVWTGNRFIVGTMSMAASRLAYSMTGTTFIAGGNGPAGTHTGFTMRAAWNGAVALFVLQSSAPTSCACTTVDGITVTIRNLPAALGAQPAIACGGGMFFVLQGSATAYTTPDGFNFTGRILPGPAYQIAYLNGLWLILSGSVYYTTLDAVAYVPRSFPVVGAYTGGSSGRLSFDANRIYLGVLNHAVVLWTIDGVFWRLRWVSQKPANNAVWHVHSGRWLLSSVGGGATILRMQDFMNADYVGTGQTCYADGAGSAASASPMYVRLK
ncbi:hypothetical protein IGB42_01926 [Andreprevotia sp. IGB-42]|uniref:hypothetical protein n=1 Tax=Andreprevotia sp. IGB-42 TaxID=2497473 RepID=UPI00135B8EB3|nr:hypothetical protein [Andreprevotia sp. IGB-42]KAF0813575.1 hypothetical protein IGB42_01926 [Andreprevotia sp. IGB-42]